MVRLILSGWAWPGLSASVERLVCGVKIMVWHAVQLLSGVAGNFWDSPRAPFEAIKLVSTVAPTIVHPSYANARSSP